MQNEKVRAKIIWTLELIEEIERIPKTYLKHVASSDGIYEIRVKHGRTILRVFCFFDRERLIILANAFQKKKKTPGEQIELAKRIKKEYAEERKSY